jgi:predicted metal-dependent peptidase
MADPAEALEELGRCVIQLLLKEPFYAHVLSGLVRCAEDGFPTAGVGLREGRLELIINPGFFLEFLTTREERVAVLKHEVLHLVMQHPFRMATSDLHPMLYNVAADLVVNQLVAPWPLPEGAVELSKFPHLSLPPDKTTEWYYDALLEDLKSRASGGGSGAQDQQNDSSQGAGGSGAGSQGASGSQGAGASGAGPQGASGSQGAGASGAGSRGASGSRGAGTSGAGSRGASGTRGAGTSGAGSQGTGASGQEEGGHGSSHSHHGAWASAGGSGASDTSGRGEAQRQQLQAAASALIERAVARAGQGHVATLDPRIRDALDAWAARNKPKVDWRRAVRIFAQSSRRTKIKISHRRESKRFESIPGLKRYPGLKVRRFQRMVVALDTSGSITRDVMEAFFSEIHGIWRLGSEIIVVECDDTIGKVYPYEGRLPEKLSGGGATAFEPVFAWMRAQRRRFDGLIYLTDGRGPAPTTPALCRVLWVLQRGGDPTACAPGRVIELPP